jgi:hypothetical protein
LLEFIFFDENEKPAPVPIILPMESANNPPGMNIGSKYLSASGPDITAANGSATYQFIINIIFFFT